MGNLFLPPGSLFAGRFLIQRVAGQGGMGTVYRATDSYSGDTVALKLLHSGHGGPDEAERFAREAELLSELRHPGIVAHVAHGQASDGRRFIAMEWLDGQDLGGRLAQGPLSVTDCLRLFQRIADALAVAHRHGVIHRDLKPTNLFLVEGDLGRVKLLDFGIARRAVPSQAMTRTGMVVGTPEYMSPEQARGSRNLTPASDLFSLGCVMYECLTGRPPFFADHVAAVLVRILFEEPVPVAEYRPGVSPQLAALLGQLLAKAPTERLADAAALQAALAGLGVLPEPALAATLALPRPNTERFAEQEQSLFSIVLAAPAEQDIGLDATQHPGGGQLGGTARQELLHGLAGLGGSADFLANGTLLVTVPPLGSAQDQAVVAARAALFVKERWPDAVVSIATGRGTIQGRTAVGEVVERAARSLRSGDSMQGKRTAAVRLDTLSAKLLEGRFMQAPQPDGALLFYEERDVDASRTLLGKPTPCVGREAELGTLESQLSACIEESEARVVLFTAPPGMGKSRLRHEFLRRVEERSGPVTVWLGRGDMMSAGAPYGILRQALNKLCGIAGSEPLDTQRERLRSRAARHLRGADADRVTVFLGELCSVPFADGDRPLLRAARADPRLMRDSVRRGFLDFLAAECAAAPVLLVLDDLQWGDEPTVGILDEALRERAESPLLILALARPEIHAIFPKLWGRHKLQEIGLKKLSKKACERLVLQVLGMDIDAGKLARAVEQCEGNALFLEELIRALAKGEQEQGSETILAMLQARLGRMDGNLRRAVRAASVFGQTFWRGGVAAVLGAAAAAPEVDSWLAALVDAEVIQHHPHSRLAEQPEYGFRHALVRDAAYSLIRDADLRTGHHLAAQFLISACESNPAAIAEHFELGGEPLQAAEWYSQAAEAALEAFSIERALRWIERGLALARDGSLLGRLYAQEGFACLLFGQILRSVPAAMKALPLVQAGSLPWTRAMFVIGVCALLGPPQWRAGFRELAEQLIACDPDPAAEAVYIEALSHTIATLCLVTPMTELAPALRRLQEVCDRAAVRNPLVRRHLYLARGRCQRTGAPTPWQIVDCLPELFRLLELTGDVRNMHVASYHQGIWAELGDADKALALLHESELADPSREELTTSMIRRAQICWLLSARPQDAARRQQVIDRASELLRVLGSFPLTALFAQDALARIHLAQGELTTAEQCAHAACQIVDSLPLLAPNALATLMRVLLAGGRTDEALRVAERGLDCIARYGCLGSHEVELRLAISEAFAAAADHDRASSELRATLHQMRLRLDDIPDPFWKDSYLTRNPSCARALQLAAQWGVQDAGCPPE